MIIRRILSLIILLLFVSLVTDSFAQNASTSLRGAVTDTTGAAIPGATVSIVNNAVGTVATAKTTGQGEYSFQQLTPGKYTITATMAGFAKYVVTADLLVAQPATINLKLGVTAESVTVDVSATAQTLNTTDASIGNSIDNETIMALPSEARNPQTLLAMQPGVLLSATRIRRKAATAW